MKQAWKPNEVQVLKLLQAVVYCHLQNSWQWHVLPTISLLSLKNLHKLTLLNYSLKHLSSILKVDLFIKVKVTPLFLSYLELIYTRCFHPPQMSYVRQIFENKNTTVENVVIAKGA
jgi:hypothetical protein